MAHDPGLSGRRLPGEPEAVQATTGKQLSNELSDATLSVTGHLTDHPDRSSTVIGGDRSPLPPTAVDRTEAWRRGSTLSGGSRRQTLYSSPELVAHVRQLRLRPIDCLGSYCDSWTWASTNHKCLSISRETSVNRSAVSASPISSSWAWTSVTGHFRAIPTAVAQGVQGSWG